MEQKNYARPARRGTESDETIGCCIILPGHDSIQGFDACVAWELERLWEQGVETECCCCGHGKRTPYIGAADAESARKMREMGYEEIEPHYEQCRECCAAFFRAKSELVCKKEMISDV